MASQLWRRRSGLDSSLMAQEVATTVARLVFTHRMPHRIESPTARVDATARDNAAAADDAAAIEIDAATGERMLREWRSHPDCGCGSLTA
jgi:hypothetical protein